MAVLDIDTIRARMEARDAKRRDAAAWCREAVLEFPDAVNALGVGPRGNPDFLKAVYKEEAQSGVWPILREDSPDNFLIEMGHGASMTGVGGLWLKGRRSDLDNVAWWLAARCGYSIDVAREMMAQAAMGESWTVTDAARAVAADGS